MGISLNPSVGRVSPGPKNGPCRSTRPTSLGASTGGTLRRWGKAGWRKKSWFNFHRENFISWWKNIHLLRWKFNQDHPRTADTLDKLGHCRIQSWFEGRRKKLRLDIDSCAYFLNIFVSKILMSHHINGAVIWFERVFFTKNTTT